MTLVILWEITHYSILKMSFHDSFNIEILVLTLVVLVAADSRTTLINRPHDLLLSADGIRVCVPHLPGETWH